MLTGDTIVALATAAVPAGRAIVRTSGPAAVAVGRGLAPAFAFAAASAGHVPLRFDGTVCPAWVYAFRGPRSYTGEDVVEYHLPGSPILARMLVDALVAAGLRPAEPGEFTARAYFAGKLGLTEVEGVAATIAAADAAELAVARQLLAGELARRLRPIADAVADTLALVELGIDFAEEEVTFLAAAEVRRRVEAAADALASLVAEGRTAVPTGVLPRFVLAGRPNAGKSTLLNALARTARAVTSAVAGTTRDALVATVDLPRGRVEIVDVAGLEVGGSTPGGTEAAVAIAADMRAAAERAVEAADRVILVHDLGDVGPPAALSRPADLVVRTKADLPVATGDTGESVVVVSAAVGMGMEDLRRRLDGLAFDAAMPGGRATMLNGRHHAAVGAARAALARAAGQAEAERVAADLRAALDAVGSIVGSVTPDDVLGRIFAGFCIGK